MRHFLGIKQKSKCRYENQSVLVSYSPINPLYNLAWAVISSLYCWRKFPPISFSRISKLVLSKAQAIPYTAKVECNKSLLLIVSYQQFYEPNRIQCRTPLHIYYSCIQTKKQIYSPFVPRLNFICIMLPVIGCVTFDNQIDFVW